MPRQNFYQRGLHALKLLDEHQLAVERHGVPAVRQVFGELVHEPDRLLPAVTTLRAQLLALQISLVARHYPAWPPRPLDLSYVWTAYVPARGLR